jgi:predicted DNA-binding protein
MQQVSFDVSLPDGALAMLEELGVSTHEQKADLVKKALAQYLEDMYLGRQAMEADKEGYIGIEEGEKWLDSMRNAKDAEN